MLEDENKPPSLLYVLIMFCDYFRVHPHIVKESLLWNNVLYHADGSLAHRAVAVFLDCLVRSHQGTGLCRVGLCEHSP